LKVTVLRDPDGTASLRQAAAVIAAVGREIAREVELTRWSMLVPAMGTESRALPGQHCSGTVRHYEELSIPFSESLYLISEDATARRDCDMAGYSDLVTYIPLHDDWRRQIDLI
jgi:hypothetical protein